MSSSGSSSAPSLAWRSARPRTTEETATVGEGDSLLGNAANPVREPQRMTPLARSSPGKTGQERRHPTAHERPLLVRSPLPGAVGGLGILGTRRLSCRTRRAAGSGAPSDRTPHQTLDKD